MAKLINEFPAINSPVDDANLLVSAPDNVTYKFPLALARDFFSRHVATWLQDLKVQIQVLAGSLANTLADISSLNSAVSGVLSKVDDLSVRSAIFFEKFHDLRLEVGQVARKVEINANGGSQDALARTLIDDLTYRLKVLELGLSGVLQVKQSSFSLAQNGIETINNAYEVIAIYERVAGSNVAPSNMTSNSSPSPYVARNANNHSGAYIAFDGLANTYIASQIIGDYIQIDLGAAYVVESYAVAPRLGNPRYWDIEASLDGLSWSTIASDSKTSGWVDQVFVDFPLGSPVTLRYFRLQDTENTGNWGLAELRIFGTGYWKRAVDSDYAVSCNEDSGLQSFSVKKLSSGSNEVLVRYL